MKTENIKISGLMLNWYLEKKFIDLNTFAKKKKENSQINDISFNLKK